MASAGWTPTDENNLGRVTKVRILGAVREASCERAAQLIDHLKKTEMAEKAQEMLAGAGWPLELLRTLDSRLPDVAAPTKPDRARTRRQRALAGAAWGQARRLP
jgi:ParB family chromosome partitioning protein